MEKVLPDLVNYNDKGQPESVRYAQLSVLLLAEIKKLRDEVEALKVQVKGK